VTNKTWDLNWSLRRLLVTANIVSSSPILVTLMMEALSSSETSVLTRATWCNIPEDAFLHSHRCVNLKSSEMLCRAALVRTDVSEERIASIIRVTRIGDLAFLRSVLRLLVAANIVPSSPILVILMMEAIRSSETSVLTRATPCNIPEDDILYSHRRENIKS
jgi:hypothetical protein